MSKKTIITIDLDGVIAKHPLQNLLVSIRKTKEKLQRKRGVKKFYYPKSNLEQALWILLNRMKKIDKDDIKALKKLKQKDIQLILVSNRFKFLETETKNWLKKNNLGVLFDQIYLNTKNIDLNEFKCQIIKKVKANYHVDDEPEICHHLYHHNNSLKIFLIGKSTKFQNTRIKVFPNLYSALKSLAKS